MPSNPFQPILDWYRSHCCRHKFQITHLTCQGVGYDETNLPRRVYEVVHTCFHCGTQQTSPRWIFRDLQDDLWAWRDGYDLSDGSLWPLDKNGERMPLAIDVLNGLTRSPTVCGWNEVGPGAIAYVDAFLTAKCRFLTSSAGRPSRSRASGPFGSSLADFTPAAGARN